MTPERWGRIDRLFHAALEREPAARSAFLAEECGGDQPLREEVESLLAAHEQSEDFIETPAADVAAELFAEGHVGLTPGRLIGHYKVLELWAAGGMGEVYLADDTRLSRRVALKLLPPLFTVNADRVRRFEQEARAASALNHPNIVTIYDIGRSNSSHYIATEFIEGETLRASLAGKAMRLDEALDIAAQIASALAAAHAAGIIHRDIKPENVMLRRDRIIKVLDFGLAKLASRQLAAAGTEAPTRALVETSPGVVMGTVQYMSPEQARGLDVDARTDIWSLGVVIYEMVTGRAPFEGETPSHVTVSIMESEPPPLARFAEVPAELERIVTKALRKDKAERYQTASDLALDLKNLKQELEVEARLKRSLPSDSGRGEATARSDGHAITDAAREPGTPTAGVAAARTTSSAEYVVGRIKRHKLAAALAAALSVIAVAAIVYFINLRGVSFFAGGETIDSVAVLPFVNASNDPDTEYLSDGISDSIINSLSRLPGLKVISLSSVLRYKGKQTDPQAVGRELNVRAVLTGRMTQRGDDLLISAELVDARDNHRLWGEQYNRKLSDIITVQSEIAQQISEKLRLRLTGAQQQQVAKHYTDNPKAYELCALGNYYFRQANSGQSGKEAFDKSIDFFEQALKIDQNYTLAYVGLTKAYFSLGQRGFWLPEESRQKAEWAALKAVELDDSLAEAHTQLGNMKEALNWDWAGAEAEFKRALELNPNSTDALFLYGTFLVHDGRPEEAIPYAKRVAEIDKTLSVLEEYPYLHLRQFDKSIEIHLKSKQGKPDRGNAHLAEAYIGKGMYQEAVAEMQKVIDQDDEPERWDRYPILAYAYAAAGRRDEALKILDQQNEAAKKGYISPYNFAIIYTGLGDRDRAFEYLNKAYEERAPVLIHFPSRPIFDPLRSDPRFADLVRRLNLPPERFVKL
jgi:serine/threonine-protein kinase